MRIAIDVDGVLAEQVPAALGKIKSRNADVWMNKSDVTEWDADIPESDTDIKQLIETELRDPEFVRSMSPVGGATEGMQRLAREGHKLVIVTDRPSPSIGPTEDWLSSLGVPYDEIISTNGRTKAETRTDVLIDDYPGNVGSFLDNDRYAILFSQPWNTGSNITNLNSRAFRAQNWIEVVETISTLHEMTQS